jgi:hypothetical protein
MANAECFISPLTLTLSHKGRGDSFYFPSLDGREGVKKLVWCCFHVIPAPYQVRGKLQPESGVFMGLQILWTPVFTGETNTV